MKKLYSTLSTLTQARLNCIEKGNSEWEAKHEALIEALVKEHLPSGSGFDAGTSFDFDKSTGDKLVLKTAFHHMNENGAYDGWTEHVVTVTPSLQFGFRLSISGPDRNQIKEYMYDVFHEALEECHD